MVDFNELRRSRHIKRDTYDVLIDRTTKWGNPFILGPDGNRAEVIQKHAVWIGTQPELIAALPELIGKTLGCHCYPLPCHGDTLSRLADVAEQNLQNLAAGNAGTL